MRGLTSSSAGDAKAEFEDITLMMIGSRVTLTDIVRIPNHPELCRGKVLDEGKRRLVLEKAKTLKGSRYDGVYIRRDLTYVQRQELKLRRERQNQQEVDQRQRPNPSIQSQTQHPVPQDQRHQESVGEQSAAVATGGQGENSSPSQGQQN